MLQGENAWIFAAEDQVSGCVKAFLDFEKALISEQPRDKKGKVKPTDITGTGFAISDAHSPAHTHFCFFLALEFEVSPSET